MKVILYTLRKSFLFRVFIILNFLSNDLYAQQTLINVSGWNAYVHVPWDYAANPTKTYPTIIFFPGLGEVGTTASLVIANGPGAYIQQGWNGNVKVDNDSVKFIIISLQPPSAYPVESSINSRIQTLKGMYRIDNARLHLTGLSMGGWCSTTFVTGDAYGGPYTYASQIATVVEVEGVKPDDNQPYPDLFDNFAKSNGRLLGFEQVNDSRDIQTRVNRMNATKANSGIFVSTNYSGGGHCCWEQFYGGSGVVPNNFTLDGINQNLYQWIARNPLPSGSQNQPPVANAGTDKTITLPTNTVTLTGSGTDADGTISSYAWTKTSGPSSGTIVSANAATTSINNLVQGTYIFQLTVTDDDGATSTDAVQVTVNAAPNQPPVANAGTDKTITLPTNTVTLTGSGTDADGTISSYAWTKTAGPSSGTIVSANAATTSINNLVQGTYIFQLTVTDNSGATSTDAVQVTVNPAPNQPPVANAGTDKTITLPTNTVTLTGSGTDADGTISSYAWTKISGPSSGTIVSANAATTAVNNLVQGTYIFQLTVTDNSGATSTDAVQVTVNPAPNQPPVANAGTDKTITLPTNTVTLTGSGTDADGTISSYAWTKISGPSSGTIVSANAATTSINNLVQGTYIFQLTVTDNSGATSTDAVQVTVNPAPNQPPVANAGTDKTITLPTNTVTLTGSGTDADGTISSYAWTKISGPSSGTIVSANAATTAVNNLVQGTYIFQLTVTDNSGATSTDAVQVTVNPAPNQPPVANAGTDKTITLPTNTVTLTGSGTDADGTISSYAWTKISGPSSGTIVSANAATTSINNLVQGTYIFQLTVTDNSGATSTDAVQVTVNPAPNQPPVANAGTDKTITLPTNTVTLTGSGTDADGTISSYAWTKISGPSSGTIVSANAATTAVNNLVQGTYIFQLTVTDNSGATSTDAVQVTVNPAPNQPPVANAGIDQAITLPMDSIILNGIGTDTDGTIISYQWSQAAGPSSAIIASATSSSSEVGGLVQGIYNFNLTVTDNNGATSTDMVQVIVSAASNEPPVANAGDDIIIMLPINYSILTGSSTHPDGRERTYSWRKISGPSSYVIVNPDQQITDVTNLIQGNYQFEFTVTSNGLSGKDTMQLSVSPAPNQLPIANAGADIIIKLPTNHTYLKGTGLDSDGTIKSYHWRKISGPRGYLINKNLAQANMLNMVQGIYMFELTVTDNDGAQGKDTTQVTVNAANGFSDQYANDYLRPTLNENKNKDIIGLSKNTLYLNVKSDKRQKMSIDLVDVSGVRFLSTTIYLEPGLNYYSKFVPGLYTGVFYVRLIKADGSKVQGLFNGN